MIGLFLLRLKAVIGYCQRHMLPQFPQFKKLELSDREDIEKITSQFPPYSDFNFTSMWCWDVDGNFRISQLNGNLVVRFADYVTGEFFYSFIGAIEVSKTAEELLRYSNNNGLKVYLKLIPGHVTNLINGGIFHVEEDRDNFDYICDVQELMLLRGTKYESHRNHVKVFTGKFNPVLLEIDVYNKDIQRQLVNVFESWLIEKGISTSEMDYERRAFARYLNYHSDSQKMNLGVFVNDELVAFWLVELCSGGYAVSHFEKAKGKRYKGIYCFLKNIGSELLFSKGVYSLNLEQDLGISGLRENKEGYRPREYLKKSIVR